MHDVELNAKIDNPIPYRLPQGQQEIQQRKLLYMGLYLLIWGEAANIRFMPECLCYIFHNVSTALICVDSFLGKFSSDFSIHCIHYRLLHF